MRCFYHQVGGEPTPFTTHNRETSPIQQCCSKRFSYVKYLIECKWDSKIGMAIYGSTADENVSLSVTCMILINRSV